MRKELLIAVASLVLSAVALVYSYVSASAAQSAAHEAVVQDLWRVLKPMYADMGLKVDRVPVSIEDALKPIFHNGSRGSMKPATIDTEPVK